MSPAPRKPPEYTYSQWLKAGCPPLELSVSQLAAWLEPPIARQRVNVFVQEERLIREGKVIKTSHPVNLAWLKDREGAEPPNYSPGCHGGDGAEGRRREAQAPAAPAARNAWEPPAPRTYQNRETEGLDINALDMDAILDAIANADLTIFRKADIDKIAKLETAAKTRVERETKRGQLIDRRLVSTVMGRMYQVDTDQIKPLGAKLAADLGAAFGVEDSASLLLIEKTVDEETARILSHIKKLMNDFLTGIGAEELVEDDDGAEEIAQLIEDTANMLRGMTLDPAIPEHAKGAMRGRIGMLEGILGGTA